MPFSLATKLIPTTHAPITLQLSDCSACRKTCDVLSKGVLCSESIECFLGLASKFFFNFLFLFRWLKLLPV
jgi:hypothetical protein